jgi:hypothetical protein
VKAGDPTRNDKFGAVREIWDMFIANCKIYYTPSVYCTVDEQLLGFRGRCRFRVYIQNKSDKYGIKIRTLCDGKSFYIVNATPYTGRVEESADVSVPAYYVRT